MFCKLPAARKLGKHYIFVKEAELMAREKKWKMKSELKFEQITINFFVILIIGALKLI